MGVECLPLPCSKRLVGVQREWHTRKREGKSIAYICVARDGSWALLSQKLPLLCEFINTHLTDGQAWSRVTTNGLFEMIDCTANRCGGWHKGMWRIQSVDLERACDAFACARQACTHAAVIAGQADCYTVR